MEQQSQSQTRPDLERQIVVPGDLIQLPPRTKAGPGTYTVQGNVYACRMGIVAERQGQVGVIPLSGVYMPRGGDLIIGIVTEVGPSNWLMDINGPYPAPMHTSETPWKIEFGETGEYLKAGEAVLCKVLFVDETKRTQVTMKEPNLRKLQGGQIIEIQPSKVARVIGKTGSMIALIKQFTDVWMFVGQNGRIWINGEPESIRVAIRAIHFIEEEAHKTGLTERMKAFLQEATGRSGNEPARAPRSEEMM